MFAKTFAVSLLAGAALLTPIAVQAEEKPTAAVTALAPVPKGRLTDAARPTAYRIDTTFDPARPDFAGRTEIDTVLNAPSRYIDLHGRDLTMTSAVATVGGKSVIGHWYDMDPTGVARLVFEETLPAGPVTLAFDYTGKVNDSPSGLFRAEMDGKWYGWSQFESIDARAAFPGFDEPGFKVPFTLTIRTPTGQTAVSNAPEVSSTVENGWQVHRFAPTLPLPTYLVAMMAGPFAMAEGAVPADSIRAKPLPLRILSAQTNKDRLDYALTNSQPIVQHLEAFFGMPFPYPKLDQIGSPLMPGAMENAGADLYNDYLIVLDENAPVSQKKSFGMVVAHELSHQWFGDLVTPAWWDDIWLNESFANYMGNTIGGQWRPDLKIGEGALAEGFAAMSTDTLLVGRPIHQPIPTNDQIDAAFDSITYGKGGHVIAMISGFMGMDKFKTGVRQYMAAHKYGNATSKDFFASLAKAAGDPRVTAAMQSFTDQQGVPLITVAGGKGKYTVTQSRYAPLGVTTPDTRWGVPVCMSRGETRKCQLLTAKSAAFTLGGSGALMPNAGGTGYYRFELPRAEWDKLIAKADTLSGPEAMALADSLSASFRAGRASPLQVVALAEKLSANPNSAASGIAYASLGSLRRAGFFSDEGLAGYRRWMGRQARASYATLGFDPRLGAYSGADPEVVQQRETMVSNLSFAKDTEIENKLASAAEAYLNGDTRALDPAFYDLAFQAYIDKGGLAAAKSLADKALASEDSSFRPAALGAVAGSGNPEIARWVLDEFNDKRLRGPERLYAVGGVAGTVETRDMGYSYLTDNLSEMMKGAQGIFIARGLPGVISGYCSAAQTNDIAKRFRPIFKGTPGALELERTIERIRNCAILKERRGAELNAALAATR
jgi:aminopeptidase N